MVSMVGATRLYTVYTAFGSGRTTPKYLAPALKWVSGGIIKNGLDIKNVFHTTTEVLEKTLKKEVSVSSVQWFDNPGNAAWPASPIHRRLL